MDQIWGSGNNGQKSKNQPNMFSCIKFNEITMNQKKKEKENTIHSTSNLSGTCSLGEGMPTK